MLVLSVPQCLRFVEAYLARPDATAAAEAIGFTEDAEAAGARILAMPSIQKRIAAARDFDAALLFGTDAEL